MQINMTKQVPVDVKEIRVHIKVCDGFDGAFVDAQGETLRDYEGYVPDFFPGDHYGDYLILNIDLETGQILNWKKPAAEDVEAYIGGTSED